MEYGIWTENDDGFTEGQLHSLPAAKERLAEIIEESDDPERDAEDLSIREICSEHEGQPKNGCEECAIEDEEEEG